MKRLVTTAVASALMISSAFADGPTGDKIKTRLTHFTGTKYVLVISYLPDEITSITCDSWTMLGLDSWKGHNNFTVPGSSFAALAVMDASGFDGYCAKPDSIVAHTDNGDFVGHLDRGAGNWSASTKLIFNK